MKAKLPQWVLKPKSGISGWMEKWSELKPAF
jgi:hypothetical protein